MGTIIKDVALLDLTQTSEEKLKDIKAIKNVAVMFYGEAFEAYMPNVSISNVASSVKTNKQMKVINGELTIDDYFASSVGEPLNLLINGELTIKPDVTVDMLNQAIEGLFINGEVYCPESLYGILQQKMEQLNGRFTTYMDEAFLETDDVTVDNHYLNQLQPGTNLAMAGQVTMTKDINLELFDEKVNQIQFLDSAVAHEVYQTILNQKAVRDSSTVTFIPASFAYIEGDLHLDSDDITRYGDGNLFVSGTVFFQEDVTEEDVQRYLTEIKTNRTIYCPKDIKSSILKKCDHSVNVVAYSGKLRTFEGDSKLTAAELDYTENSMTIIVSGVLNIDPNVDPNALYEKVDRLDLTGVVSGNTEQCGVLQMKVGIKNGVLDSGVGDNEEDSEEPYDDDTYISDIAHLEL